MYRARIIYLLLFLSFWGSMSAQTSPLSKGKWAKIATTKQGVYKLTGVQLRSLGFSIPIATSQLQLFNYDLSSLSEKVPVIPTIGLSENAIKVVDGGDGQIDDVDYILFYNQGPIYWKYDSILNRIKHFNNSSADSVYYFLTIGANGKRITNQNQQSNTNDTREMFSQHYLFEKDSISLLNSGKVFYGIPMGQGIGKQPQLNYTFTTQGMNSVSTLKSFIHMASTSYGANGQFDFSLNDQAVKSSVLFPVSGLLFDNIASELIDSFNVNAVSNWPVKSNLKVNYSSVNSTSTGWLDYIEVLAKKPVGFWQDSVIQFNIEDGFVKGGFTNCKVQNTDATSIIWNITNASSPTQITLQLNGNGVGSFIQATDSIANFIGVSQNAFETPTLLGPIANQNIIQNNGQVDYVIIAAPAFMNAAVKYQQYQISKFGRKAIAVNAKEIYNDFSGAQVSAVAIRNFLKLLYSQALQNNYSAPKYLLLLGMGNFNTKKLNSNFELPVYENDNSNSILSSFSTDDFFSILKTGDDINNVNSIRELALAVGRIPARTIAEADTVISKLINYQSNKIGGAWENKITWVADDGDYNLHLQDAESIISHLQTKTPSWNQNKIYLDLFPAVSSTSGNTYPLAFNAIQQTANDGTLLLNYTGHGNYLRLSEEAVISQAQFERWDNAKRLPLMVTASCNFAPFDQPTLSAIAWDVLMKNGKGIIGLVAANRLVFAYSNKQINDLFIQQLLVKDNTGQYNSIGQALQKAKISNWTLGGDRVNDFKFNIIGDPALQLSLPNYEVVVKNLNNKQFIGHDTLLSGNKYKIEGTIQDKGIVKSNFNGLIDLIIYDAIKNKKTLANQSTSMSVPIAVQENILFKGKATVVNGLFNIDFILPMQVSNTESPIRIELAASSDSVSAIKIIDSVYVKANTIENKKDTIGPVIKAYLNDSLFKQGGWASPNSILYISLSDTSGIQTSGNALGHDLSVWLDEDPIPIIINNYFVADINSYQSGKIQFALPTLREGKHKCIIKAWDLLGNSSTYILIFEVPKSKDLVIKNAFNFPNPFRQISTFGFETNQVGNEIQIEFEVMDISGQKLYRQAFKLINYTNKVFLSWDGVTNTGALLKPGTYYYRFTILTNSGTATIANTFIKL